MSIIKPASIKNDLPELPEQPKDVPWPTDHWPRASLADVSGQVAAVEQASDAIFDLTEKQGCTYALLIVKDGKLVHERYDHGANGFYLQYSWSMAKSITQTLIGILAKAGKLDIYQPLGLEEWQDERAAITWDQLLRMASGLKFNEDYVDGEGSDVINMLQFEGRHDMGAFAANMPLLHEPGSFWNYSSGTTNILCREIKRLVGGGASGLLQFMNDELFEPIGVRTATPKFDTSGTFIGSSFLLATPQDFARYGYLHLRGGSWDGREIISQDWVDYARSPWINTGEEAYGAHWWMKPDNPDWFFCSGYDGQRILCVPEKDLVMVRLGRTNSEEVPYVWEHFFKIAELI